MAIYMTKIGYKKKGAKFTEDYRIARTIISKEQYNNIVDAKRFFENLGGTERHEKGYTYEGYTVLKIISTSPDKTIRSIYEFKFIS